MQLCLRYTAKATHCVKLFMIKRTTNICTLWLEQGFIGLAFFVAILGVCFVTLRKAIASTRSRFRHALLIGVLAICCAAIFQTLFDFNLQIVRIRIFFFVSLAMIFILAKYDSHSEHSKRA